MCQLIALMQNKRGRPFSGPPLFLPLTFHAAPYHTTYQTELSSFENFQLGLQKKLSEDEYYDATEKDGGWKLYQAALNEKILAVQHKAQRDRLAFGSLLTTSLILLIANLFSMRRNSPA
jgi:hypothetical protein